MPVSALFASTLALSAGLLFAIQPLVARMALPALGGTPAVWNTCMVFFQAAVLGGYALAHLLATRACRRTQLGVFLVLIVIGAIRLPADLTGDMTQTPVHPVTWLLGKLAGSVGFPALAMATASPLLQHWLGIAQVGARTPYYLYAASNVGSLGALIAYPALIERLWPLAAQAQWWTVAYAAWGFLVFLCGALTLMRERESRRMDSTPAPRSATSVSATDGDAEASPSRTRILSWIGLGAIPASLLQGCTLFLTTDVASIPLLWVVPLGLYLLSFVVAFSSHGRPAVRTANRILPFLACGLLFAILARSTQPVLLLVGLHLAFLLAAGLVAHGRLMATRPPARFLTLFYLTLALGGVLGGSFNALLAPRLFHSVAEYPVGISLACVALTPRAWRRSNARTEAARMSGNHGTGPSRVWVAAPKDFAWAIAFGVGITLLGLVVPWLTGENSRLRDGVVFGLAAVACCTQLDRPGRLSACLAAAFLAGLWIQSKWAGTRHAERNFFGITRVTRDGGGRYHQLVHGNTIHGRQFRDGPHPPEPLTYYHRDGPLGRVFPEFAKKPAPRRIAAVGLGIGSVAAYATPDEDWSFFEIDPAVIRVAGDTNWFSFLAETRAGRWRIIEGDARLRLSSEPEGTYDLVLLDAFSSDAIPVHLLTREALTLYQRKLRPDGWLLIHISNRYLELEPVVAALAQDAGMTCRSADDPDEDPGTGKEPSHWMLLARRAADLGGLARQSLWTPATTDPRIGLWTDQRAPVLEAFVWRQSLD